MRCWEVVDPRDPALCLAQHLYETTQAIDEQIPWEWIARVPERRQAWSPGKSRPHLLLATARDDPAALPLGFSLGTYLPQFGGYISYLGVDQQARRHGIATSLFTEMFRLLADDARLEGATLPFVVWESRPPEANSSLATRKNWEARLRLFERVGGWWVDGLTFWAPTYVPGGDNAIGLQLFVRPWDLLAHVFDAQQLCCLAQGLYERIYRRGPGDPLYEQTLSAAVSPSLRPISLPTRPVEVEREPPVKR